MTAVALTITGCLILGYCFHLAHARDMAALRAKHAADVDRLTGFADDWHDVADKWLRAYQRADARAEKNLEDFRWQPELKEPDAPAGVCDVYEFTPLAPVFPIKRDGGVA